MQRAAVRPPTPPPAIATFNGRPGRAGRPKSDSFWDDDSFESDDADDMDKVLLEEVLIRATGTTAAEKACVYVQEVDATTTRVAKTADFILLDVVQRQGRSINYSLMHTVMSTLLFLRQ
jgi:hypothetical protein